MAGAAAPPERDAELRNRVMLPLDEVILPPQPQRKPRPRDARALLPRGGRALGELATSEFGRRLRENGSCDTDHGSA